jgi:FMNH2-dependent dimethyl sulfone monooxygenase
MRFGYWMPVFGGWLRNIPDEGMEASWDYVRRLTQRSEQTGWDLSLIAELNLNDIKGVEEPALDAWSTAAALAAVTETIELMVAVRPNFHHPALFAKQAANIDNIAGGRLALNVVSSWWAGEAKQYGLQFDQHDDRYGRTSEWLKVVDGLWSQKRFSYAGDRYQLDQAICEPKPVKRPRPTIYAGGESEAAKTMIAEQCDAYVMHGIRSTRSCPRCRTWPNAASGLAAWRWSSAWPPSRSSVTAKPRRSASSRASPRCRRARPPASTISTNGCRAPSSSASSSYRNIPSPTAACAPT